ncbi:hypothetical protein GGR56DRAFT_689380 [Xylariaceae sp. FL0804]|nr:hypothetical protein GGR56DRAFT_689380 [Xylariaceae sp. FL0804]
MSRPRAWIPLLEVGSRFLSGPLAPRPTGRAALKLSSSRPPTTAPSICLSCRYSFAPRRQVRWSSTSKRPEDNESEIPKEHNDASSPGTPPFSGAASSSSSSPPPFPEGLDPIQMEQQTAPNPPPPREESQQQQPQASPPPPERPPAPETDPSLLPSAQNARRSRLDRSLASFMDRAQDTLFAASQRLNDLTGYSGIEGLKAAVSRLEARLGAAQSGLVAARAAYKTAVAERSGTQREVTTLLARQKTWTPPDFERFTALYRQDYELEAAVGDRATRLEEAEREAERLARDLSAAILARYHEEQVWSDKIRRMSTWGTWGLMGVNVLLFLVFQFGAEPWRRRRLVAGFEDKVRAAIGEERARDRAEAKADAAAAAAAATAATAARAREEPFVDQQQQQPAVVVPVAADATAGVEQLPETEFAPPPPPPPASTSASTSTPAPAAPAPAPVVEEQPPPPPALSWQGWREALAAPDRWASRLADLLLSERTVVLRARDVSLVALEGAVAGAALAAAVAAALFLRRT